MENAAAKLERHSGALCDHSTLGVTPVMEEKIIDHISPWVEGLIEVP